MGNPNIEYNRAYPFVTTIFVGFSKLSYKILWSEEILLGGIFWISTFYQTQIDRVVEKNGYCASY